jgi:hypothetical protein
MKLLLPVLMCALLANAQACEAATAPTAASLTSDYKTTAGNVATGLAISLPVLATGLIISKGDRAGAGEWLTATIMSVGTVYALNTVIHEERPDLRSDHSFPAITTALAASSSTYLWARYGWRYGLPAFAVSSLVSLSLTQAKKAHWYDTLTSSFIATGYGAVITRRFKSRYNIETRVSPMPGGGFVSFSYDW